MNEGEKEGMKEKERLEEMEELGEKRAGIGREMLTPGNLKALGIF